MQACKEKFEGLVDRFVLVTFVETPCNHEILFLIYFRLLGRIRTKEIVKQLR